MPRICSVCQHPDRHRIEHALLAGATLASLAQEFHLSTSALSRHHQHLKEKIHQAVPLLELQRQQDYLVQLTTILKLVVYAAEAFHAASKHELVLKCAREASTLVKISRSLKPASSPLAAFNLLLSPYYVSHGPIVTDHPEFYAYERRLFAEQFFHPCPENCPPPAADTPADTTPDVTVPEQQPLTPPEPSPQLSSPSSSPEETQAPNTPPPPPDNLKNPPEPPPPDFSPLTAAQDESGNNGMNRDDCPPQEEPSFYPDDFDPDPNPTGLHQYTPEERRLAIEKMLAKYPKSDPRRKPLEIIFGLQPPDQAPKTKSKKPSLSDRRRGSRKHRLLYP